jgi:hypothetical protein
VILFSRHHLRKEGVNQSKKAQIISNVVISQRGHFQCGWNLSDYSVAMGGYGMQREFIGVLGGA